MPTYFTHGRETRARKGGKRALDYDGPLGPLLFAEVLQVDETAEKLAALVHELLGVPASVVARDRLHFHASLLAGVRAGRILLLRALVGSSVRYDRPELSAALSG